MSIFYINFELLLNMNFIKNYCRDKGVRRLRQTFLSKGEDSWAIVTGCTSGIGKAYAEILAENGFKIILFSRNEEKMKSLKLPENCVKIFKCDFTKDDLYTNDKFNAYLDTFKHLNIKLLINNVGQSSELGDFYNFDINRHKSMVNVNINSHIFMTQLFILSQKDKPDEQFGIINISSYYGTRPVPGVTLYSSCKSFLTTFSQCTAHEVSKQFKVLTVNPLFVKTNMVRLKESFFVIKPEDLVYSSFGKIGRNYSYGDTRHTILAWLFNIIPDRLFCKYALNYYRDLYNKLKRK
jgi:17beta-estradiol 17-dehydrogenase / very-long-chain 3-oxoacyl-CoA reductase